MLFTSVYWAFVQWQLHTVTLHHTKQSLCIVFISNLFFINGRFEWIKAACCSTSDLFLVQIFKHCSKYIQLFSHRQKHVLAQFLAWAFVCHDCLSELLTDYILNPYDLILFSVKQPLLLVSLSSRFFKSFYCADQTMTVSSLHFSWGRSSLVSSASLTGKLLLTQFFSSFLLLLCPSVIDSADTGPDTRPGSGLNLLDLRAVVFGILEGTSASGLSDWGGGGCSSNIWFWQMSWSGIFSSVVHITRPSPLTLQL